MASLRSLASLANAFRAREAPNAKARQQNMEGKELKTKNRRAVAAKHCDAKKKRSTKAIPQNAKPHAVKHIKNIVKRKINHQVHANMP